MGLCSTCPFDKEPRGRLHFGKKRGTLKYIPIILLCVFGSSAMLGFLAWHAAGDHAAVKAVLDASTDQEYVKVDPEVSDEVSRGLLVFRTCTHPKAVNGPLVCPLLLRRATSSVCPAAATSRRVSKVSATCT
jgi:hypothetical protein